MRGLANRDTLTLADNGGGSYCTLTVGASMAFSTTIQNASQNTNNEIDLFAGTVGLHFNSSSSGAITSGSSTFAYTNVRRLWFGGAGGSSSLLISGGAFNNETYTGFAYSSSTVAVGSIAFDDASVNYSGFGGIVDTSYATNLSFVDDSLHLGLFLGDGPVFSGTQTGTMTIGVAPFSIYTIASNVVSFANKTNVATSSQLGNAFTFVELHVQPRGLKNLTLNPGVGSTSGAAAGAIVSATPSGVTTTLVKSAAGYVQFYVGDAGLNSGVPIAGVLGILGQYSSTITATRMA